MGRFSISMDDVLVEQIDFESTSQNVSRSDWINDACKEYMTRISGLSGILPATAKSSVIKEKTQQIEHNMTDYESTYQAFSIAAPEYLNFGLDVIDAWAERDRNKIAMVWTDQSGAEKFFTFRDLQRKSNQIVNMFLKYDIKKGDRVLVMLHRVPEWWFALIALMKIGAPYIPAPTLLTEKDLAYRINAAHAKMIITDEENADKVEAICSQCPSLSKRMVVDSNREGWISYLKELDYPAPVSSKITNLDGMEKTKPTDPMLIFFSSGTTGEPKMVVHTQSYALGHIVTARFWHDLRPNDLHFTVSDTGWGKAAWGKLFGQWIIGAAVFVYDYRSKFNATELLPLIEKYGITSFCAPPTIYRMLIMADLKKYDFTELRHCVSAGEAINPEVIRAWKEMTGRTIYEGYGQTETTLVLATFPCMEPKYGSMGKPCPGWHVEVHTEEGKKAPVGEEGSIAISIAKRPNGFFTEYVDNPQANEESFRNGFYYTGDRAYVDSDGYFWFVGRDDDVIKSSGYRIGPFEVESVLMEHPAVVECAVIGVPDIIRGFVVKAFVVLKEGYTPSDSLVRDLQKYAKEVTAPYKYPRQIEFIESLPKTISGKIKRKELREQEAKKHNK
ncbi:MAG: AMP-binding protein [Euryarchaeota archaeon]|nr:AMP-binding protein [Euryarchaeota archaeon]